MESVQDSISRNFTEENVINVNVTGDGVVNQSKQLPIDMQFNDGHIISISVYSVLFILSAVGNITILTSILCRKRSSGQLSRMDFLLVHLAIADLMVTFFMMPLEIGWAATVYWRTGDLSCRIMSFFRIFGLFLSGFVLVCLAIDRYLAVRYPMHGLASTRRAKIMVTSAWLLAAVCSFPQVWIFHVERHPDFPWYTQCVTYNFFSKPEYDLLYQLFGMIMMYALPLILLVVLYGSIAIELYKMSHSSSVTFTLSDSVRRTRGDIIERAKVKSIQMTFLITFMFLICWTPYYVMCVWYWTDPETAQRVDQRIQKGLFLFACTNSTVNPVVYGMFNMKAAYRRERLESNRDMGGHRMTVTTPFIRGHNSVRQTQLQQTTKGRQVKPKSENALNKTANCVQDHHSRRETIPLIIIGNGCSVENTRNSRHTNELGSSKTLDSPC